MKVGQTQTLMNYMRDHMENNLKITLPNTDDSIEIEQMPSIPKGMHPFDEEIDWLHTYAKVTNEVFVGYHHLDGETNYIIVGHIPSGTRIKIRYTDYDNPIEDFASIPRRFFDKQ